MKISGSNIIFFGICLVLLCLYLLCEIFCDSITFDLKKVYIFNGILKYEETLYGYPKYKTFSKKTLLRKLNNFSEEELLQLGVDLKKLSKNKSELISKLYFENELINLLNSEKFREVLTMKKVKKEEFLEFLNNKINENKKMTVEEKIEVINEYLKNKVEISDEVIAEKYKNL